MLARFAYIFCGVFLTLQATSLLTAKPTLIYGMVSFAIYMIGLVEEKRYERKDPPG